MHSLQRLEVSVPEGSVAAKVQIHGGVQAVAVPLGLRLEDRFPKPAAEEVQLRPDLHRDLERGWIVQLRRQTLELLLLAGPELTTSRLEEHLDAEREDPVGALQVAGRHLGLQVIGPVPLATQPCDLRRVHDLVS